MIIVDTHCDTLLSIWEAKNNDIFKNQAHLDIDRMRKYKGYTQFFAAFIDPIYNPGHSIKRAIQLFETLMEQINNYSQYISLCVNFEEIQNCINNSKIAAIMSLEGAEALQGDLSLLKAFYRLGLRSICLTWNHRNEVADGVEEGITCGGLTLFGRELIKNMNDMGMIVDVSHLAKRGFWDVIELSNQPIIASHSNAQSLCKHIRNLDDSQIKALAKNGGVIGVTFVPNFLKDDGISDISDIIKHIEYIVSLVGADHIGIGSDFDGTSMLPNGINGVQDIGTVLNELLRLNYSQNVVEKIAGLNFMRVIKQILI